MPPELDRQLQLGADAVIGGDQQGIAIARRLQVEKAAESAQLGIGPGARGRFGQRPDRLDQRIAGGNRNARVGVGQWAFRDHGSAGASHNRAWISTPLSPKALAMLSRRPKSADRPAAARRDHPVGRGARADGKRRARHPADRQLGHARDRRHPCRCRRQGCADRRASPAGASPSAKGSRRCGRKSTSRPLSEAPNLSDSVLDGLVSSIIVEREQIGTNRYIADLGILFDRDPRRPIARRRRAGPPLGADAAHPGHDQRRHRDQRRAAQSVAARLGAVPDLVERDRLCPGQRARDRSAAGQRRPDAAAGPRLRGATSSISMARPTCWSPRSRSTGSIRAARPSRRFIGRQGPDGRLLGSFELRARDSAGHARDDERGRAADGRVVHAGARGGPAPARPDPDHAAAAAARGSRGSSRNAGARDASTRSSSSSAMPASLAQRRAQIRGISGVDAVSERSVALGASSLLLVTYRGRHFGACAIS